MASVKKKPVCVSYKRAVELGLRKAPKAGTAAAKLPLSKLYKTTEGKRFQTVLKELTKYRQKVKSAKQSCSDLTTLTNQAVRYGTSFLSTHAGDMTRAQSASLRKRLTKLEKSRKKFCSVRAKQIAKAEAAAKKASSLRGRRR